LGGAGGDSGTMVCKGSAADSGTMVCKGSAADSGTMVCKGSAADSGTMVDRGSGNGSTVPAFMRQFDEAAPAPPTTPSATALRSSQDRVGVGGVAWTADGSVSPEAAPEPAPSPAAVAATTAVTPAVSAGRDGDTVSERRSAGAKFDFSKLSIAEIDEELASQQANFERDVGRLRKQYERRGRALRAARVARLADE